MRWSTAILNNLNQFLVQGGANMDQYSNTNIQTEMFTAGQQETLKDAQIAVTNFLCHLHYIYEITKEKRCSSLITQLLIKILEWTNQKYFKRWVEIRLPTQK